MNEDRRRREGAVSARPLKYDRGRLLTPQDIAAEIFRGCITVEWVREHLRSVLRARGRRLFAWEYDVFDWIEKEQPNA